MWRKGSGAKNVEICNVGMHDQSTLEAYVTKKYRRETGTILDADQAIQARTAKVAADNYDSLTGFSERCSEVAGDERLALVGHGARDFDHSDSLVDPHELHGSSQHA